MKKGRAYGLFRENIKGLKWSSGYFMLILDYFGGIYFRNFGCSSNRFVIYPYYAVFNILRSYDIRAVLFRDFYIYLALYGDSFLNCYRFIQQKMFFDDIILL